jgi:hypothetical protein
MTQALGRDPTPGEAYMGHLLGAYGAAQLLTADPNAKCRTWWRSTIRSARPRSCASMA